MTDVIKAIILGIIEGLTEFLPVSSTGHLILAGDLLNFERDAAITFKIVIQLGAVMAVLILYWKRYMQIGSNLIKMDFSQSKGLNVIHMILAMLPGVSRSGSTISGGLLLGTSQKAAADFTFFICTCYVWRNHPGFI